MMKKEITKYIVVRDTIGKNGRHYRRFEESNSETHACWFAKSRPLTNANTTIYVYEIEGEMPKKKTEVMESGELILECNLEGVVYDRRKEATAEPEHEASVEPIALAFDNKDDAPVVKPSKWMVGTAEDEDGNLNYVVYRLLDGDAPDEEGNRELRGIFDSIKAARAYAADRNYLERVKAEPEAVHDEPKAEAAEPTEEAPAPEPVKAGEPVRYYVVLKVAENRRQTKFHFKRRTFYDDQDAIDFARSRLRGGCKSAAVFMYDPAVIREPTATFETMDAQHDAKTIKALLWAWEIYYTDRTAEVDSRDAIHYQLMKTQTGLKPYLSEEDNELVKHAQHFEEDGTAYKSLALVTMLCDADIRYTDTVRQNADIMTLAEAECWYKEATA